MVRNALIVDTETTSLDPTTGKVIEVAAALPFKTLQIGEVA